jgi:predicted CopG family antitoxin
MENIIAAMVKTIKLDEEVHSRLAKHGSIGETFQEVIIRLLDYYEEREGKPRKIKTNIDDEESSFGQFPARTSHR